MSHTARVLVVVLLASIALGAGAVPASYAASTCTTTWNGGSGFWNTAANWSSGVPNGSSVACITAAGSQVLANGGDETAGSLILGGASGTATLQVYGVDDAHHGLLVLTAQSAADGIGANGQLILGEYHHDPAFPADPTKQRGTHGVLTVTAGGTLTNRGTLVSAENFNSENQIRGDLDNQGTFTVEQSLYSSTPSHWTSSGSITVAATKTVFLDWTAASSFTQTGGSIVNNGSWDQSQGAFTASGNGTATGNPLQFDGGVTISPSGSGSGTFQLRSGGDVLGSDIASGYTLRVAGRPNAHHGLLTVPANRTNSGTLLLGDVDGTHGVINVASGMTLTNAATLRSTTTGNGANTITGNLANTGTFTVDEDLTSGAPSVWTSSGSITVAAGKSVALDWNGASSFAQSAGTLSNSGVWDQSQGSFTAAGGAQNGNPLQFDGGVTLSLAGTGSGSFQARSGGDTLASDISAGYTLRVAGRPGAHHGLLTVTGPKTNHGTLRLGDVDGTHGVLSIASGVFTNQGNLFSSSTGANGPNTINGNLDNQGTLSVDEDLQSTVPAAWTTSGGIAVATNKTVTLNWNTGASLTQAGGTIANHGTFIQSSGTFTADAGTETDKPLRFDGEAHLNPSGTGSGSFQTHSGSASLDSDIGSGYTVIVGGTPGSAHGNLTTSAARTNHGTLVLGTQDSTHGNLTLGGPLTNAGTLRADPTGVGGTSNGPDTITGSVQNSGTVTVNETLAITGDYTQLAGGKLSPFVGGTADGEFRQTQVGGAATLDGTLELRPSDAYAAAAATGDTIPVLTDGSRSGTFTQVTSSPPLAGGKSFTASYDDANHRVNAVVAAAPVPTPTPTPTPTATATATATASATASPTATATVKPTVKPPAALTLTGVSLKRKSFRARKGTLLRLTLSRPAVITVVVKLGARKKATFTFIGKAGANAFVFKVKKLKPGRYRALIAARDQFGNTTKAPALKFKILR